LIARDFARGLRPTPRRHTGPIERRHIRLVVADSCEKRHQRESCRAPLGSPRLLMLARVPYGSFALGAVGTRLRSRRLQVRVLSGTLDRRCTQFQGPQGVTACGPFTCAPNSQRTRQLRRPWRTDPRLSPAMNRHPCSYSGRVRPKSGRRRPDAAYERFSCLRLRTVRRVGLTLRGLPLPSQTRTSY